MFLVWAVFWTLLLLGRKELGVKWLSILAGLWLAALAVPVFFSGLQGCMMAVHAALAIVVTLAVLKGDVRIRG